MFSKLKNFFGKFSGGDARPLAVEVTPSSEVVAQATVMTRRPASAQRSAAPIVSTSTNSQSEGEALAIPWDSILVQLPEPLKAHVSNPGRATGSITVPAQRIHEQLRSGAVRIAFGELRKAAPPGVFVPGNGADMTLIDLPMREILSRLPQERWLRRPQQKRVQIPDDVPAIFGPEARAAPRIGSANAPGSAPPPATPAASVETSPSPASQRSASPTTSDHTTRFSKNALNQPAKPTAGPSAVPLIAPLAKAVSHTTRFFRSATPAAPASVSATAAPPVSSVGHTTRFFRADQLAPAKAATTSNLAERKSQSGRECLEFKLQSLVTSWPESIGQEMVQDGLAHADVQLPFTEIENGIKRGKILASWKQIRSWIAAPLPLGNSPLGDVQVELSLAAVVPVFLQRTRPGKNRKSLAVGENIPDIFSSTPGTSPLSAEPNSSPAEGLLASVAPNRSAAPAAPSSPPAASGVADLSQIFELPDKRNWTPVEIVQRTASLRGVAGAVIALQDGLLVAGEMPSGRSAETFAAFLAPMFAKITQYSKELSLGELTQLALFTGQQPLHIFKSGKIYFAVLGRPDQGLPLAKLSAIAAAFGRNLK